MEVGPKKALQGFAEDVLGDRSGTSFRSSRTIRSSVMKSAFNQALCGLYAAGLGRGIPGLSYHIPEPPAKAEVAPPARPATAAPGTALTHDKYSALGHMLAEVFERAGEMMGGQKAAPATHPPVITGAALGLPGAERIFDDGNVARILKGDQLIGSIPDRFRRDMLDKHITRLMKTDNGGPTFETIDSVGDVIKLAGRGRAFDLEKDFGVPADRLAAFDRVTQLAIAVGLDALRDAGIPLVMRYKTTTTNTQLPDRWGLPDSMRDDTGVIFASAFPGLNAFAEEMARYYADRSLSEQLALIEDMQSRRDLPPFGSGPGVGAAAARTAQ